MAMATKEQSVVDRVAKQLYIGGEWRDASGGETLAVEDPATGEALCEIADGTAEDAKAALDAAVAKQAEWAATPPNQRSEILWRVFEALNEHADDLALLMTLEMGKTIAESKAEIAYSADNVLKVSMELGGNAPFLIFDDADLDAAVEGAMIAKMRNIGEACTAANRFHVADSVAGDFAEKLAERMRKLRVGRGTEDEVDVGPLIDDDQRGKVADLVQDAVGKGAKALVGGSTIGGAGDFYEPTVLADVPPEARVLKEEIVGPAAPAGSAGAAEDAIAAADGPEYGV